MIELIDIRGKKGTVIPAKAGIPRPPLFHSPSTPFKNITLFSFRCREAPIYSISHLSKPS